MNTSGGSFGLYFDHIAVRGFSYILNEFTTICSRVI